MKKILTLAIVFCSMFCVCSCSKGGEEKTLSFSPSLITLSVGETAYAELIVKGIDANDLVYELRDLLSVTSEASIINYKLILTGDARGTATGCVYYKDDPSIKATVQVTVQ